MAPHAQAARAKASEALVGLFQSVDLVLAPTARSTAPAPDAAPTPITGDAPDHADAFVLGANLAGLPALTLPVSLGDGLPAAAHLIGRHFGEPLLVRAAAALERLASAEARA